MNKSGNPIRARLAWGEPKKLLSFVPVPMLLLAGCVHLPPKRAARLPKPLPTCVASEFNAPAARPSKCEETLVKNESRYALRRVELTFDRISATSNITIDYYQVEGRARPSPVIVLLPISGGGYEVESHFARYFAKHGLAVALVHRREVGKQTPKASEIEGWLKQNIACHKRVLDWIETRSELDAHRIGLFGISMGGIQAALLTPLDDRVKAATFGLAAGDLPFVLAHSTEKSIARHRAEFMRAHQMNRAQFQDELRKAITCDPALLAPYVEQQRILLVLGFCDTVVPFDKGWELRGKLGKPETLILPTGHYSALFCIPYVKNRCLHFFRKHL